VAPSTFQPDASQERVLDHQSGVLLVTGTAGTGKSAVLAERLARLIESGEDPERAALIVRSKRHRGDARSALLARLPVPLPSLRVFTAHALAYHVLGERFGVLGYAEPPKVLSAADHFAKVRELLMGEDRADWPTYGALLGLHGFADQVRQFLLQAQEALVEPEDVLEASERRGDRTWRELGSFYRRYLDVLASEGVVDFAGLITQAAAAADAGEAPFDHILVDDYQDVTLSFERLVTGLGAPDLVAAGDPEAHVFSFQGTTDEPLLHLASMRGVAQVELDTRHRGSPVRVDGWHAPHVSEELAAVARECRRIHVQDGIPWRRLAAVTRRQGAQVAALVRALEDSGIPHSALEGPIAGSEPSTVPYRLALRWLRAGADERDELVEAVLTSELGGLSPASARTLLRAARADGRPRRDALELNDGLTPNELASLSTLRTVLDRAEQRSSSVLDAFAVLWRELPCSATLVRAAGSSHTARGDLDAVVAFSRAVEEAGGTADPSIEAFLSSLEAREGAPEAAGAGDRERDAVRVLTAHAAAGLEFDTVFVVGAVEGNFPSLSRPEPMFDLSTLGTSRSRSQVLRDRLADERRLFRMVLDRASRRVVLTASEPEGPDAVASVSRFGDEQGIEWVDVPIAPFSAPVSVSEATATWRRTLADPTESTTDRLASLDGLLALGVDPASWWFQLDWSDLEAPPRDELHLSYSRLDHLENCELQYALADELGLDGRGGHQAWVGHLIHSIIEDCERGKVERTPEAFAAELERRWQQGEFPSFAISEAERRNALDVLIPNWFERYGDLPAAETERRFSFAFDGAVVNGVIDRIGPVPEGGTRITDYKTGRADKAKKASENLQLGIYYLAVDECDDLAEHRPVSGVELAFLGGRRNDPALALVDWPVHPEAEEDYQQRMRERLGELIDRVRALEGSGSYRAQTTAECFFCSFRTLCSRYPEGGTVFPVPDPEAEVG
jgi:superfamily I DNA/RNA helicase